MELIEQLRHCVKLLDNRKSCYLCTYKAGCTGMTGLMLRAADALELTEPIKDAERDMLHRIINQQQETIDSVKAVMNRYGGNN